MSLGRGTTQTASIHSDKDTTASSLSFRYWGDAITIPEGQNQQDVRVTVSKTSGKYQLQSESFAALSVIATELVRRLGEYFGDEDSGERRRSEMGSSAAGEGEIAHDKGGIHNGVMVERNRLNQCGEVVILRLPPYFRDQAFTKTKRSHFLGHLMENAETCTQFEVF